MRPIRSSILLATAAILFSLTAKSNFVTIQKYQAVAPTGVEYARRMTNRTFNGSASARAFVEQIDGPPTAQRRPGRFPRYGTDEFSRRCRWTTNAMTRHLHSGAGTDCTFYARPRLSSEGLASWVSEVATGSLYASQAGCRLLLDYGPDVEVHKVLEPVDNSTDRNWTVPDGFQCQWKNKCVLARGYKEKNLKKLTRHLGQKLLSVPGYRFIYNNGVDPSQFEELSWTLLPGFRVEDGMACALNSAFALAPSASDFVPHLFTVILPAVRDEDTLVLALYVRTGNTEEMAKMKKEGQEVKLRLARKLSQQQESIIQCALYLEGKGLLDPREPPVSSVVWMVITDAPSIGQLIVSKYHDHETVPAGDSPSDDPNVSDVPVVRRKVLTTSARGMQTRPQNMPSTADFAEALIDWYLLGESDAVILSHGLSFGATGAMRTARPIYHAGRGCIEQTMVSKSMQGNHTEPKQ